MCANEEKLNETQAQEDVSKNPYANLENFKEAQRMSLCLSSQTGIANEFISGKVPQNTAIANCLMAMDLANGLKLPVTSVMRGIYFVHNRPQFYAQFLIGMFNRSDKWFPMKFKYEYDEKGTLVSVHAEARHKETGEVYEGPRITKQMVTKNGWKAKFNELPEIQYSYRAAQYFVRLYAPEVIMCFDTDYSSVVDTTATIVDDEQTNSVPTSTGNADNVTEAEVVEDTIANLNKLVK